MKRTERIKKPLALVATLTFFVAAFQSPALGDPVAPWDPASTDNLTLFWNYNFNDGVLLPTVSSKGGHSTVPTDPLWAISGSGTIISIVGGQLGIHDATQPSQVDLFLQIPNSYDANNVKFVWFAYDFGGQAPIPTAGTTNAGHTVSGITYSPNTVGNHVEGFITIDPQPMNEWLNLRLSAGIGETTFIDNLQVGSTCIPEPASVIMLLIGGALLTKGRKLLRR